MESATSDAARRAWGWTVLITAAALATHFTPGGFELLSYRRPEILAGQWWRLVTGHLTHGSHQHLAWNLLAFVPLSLLTARRLGPLYAPFLGGAALLIGGGMLLSLPRLIWYCGMSGVDMALFSFLLADGWAGAWERRRPGPIAVYAAITAALVAKLGYEAATGRMILVRTPGLALVPAAHQWGLLAGVAARLFLPLRDGSARRR